MLQIRSDGGRADNRRIHCSLGTRSTANPPRFATPCFSSTSHGNDIDRSTSFALRPTFALREEWTRAVSAMSARQRTGRTLRPLRVEEVVSPWHHAYDQQPAPGGGMNSSSWKLGSNTLDPQQSGRPPDVGPFPRQRPVQRLRDSACIRRAAQRIGSRCAMGFRVRAHWATRSAVAETQRESSDVKKHRQALPISWRKASGFVFTLVRVVDGGAERCSSPPNKGRELFHRPTLELSIVDPEGVRPPARFVISTGTPKTKGAGSHALVVSRQAGPPHGPSGMSRSDRTRWKS